MTPLSTNPERTVGLCELSPYNIVIGKFHPPLLREWLRSITENFGRGDVYLSFANGTLIATLEPKDEVGVCVCGMDE